MRYDERLYVPTRFRSSINWFFFFLCDFRKDLVNQEARFTAQLEEAEKQAISSQTKANDLAYQINELERNLTVMTWNVERKFKSDVNSRSYIGSSA